MTSRRDLHQTIELAIGGGVTAVLTLAYMLGAGRILGPAYYADFSAAMSVFYFVAVALSPLAPTTARLVALYAARGELDRIAELQSTLRKRILHWSALAAIPALIALVPLARAFHFASATTLAVAFTSTVAFTVVSIRRGVLQGLERFREHNVNIVIEAALRLGGAMLILMFVKTPTAALISYLAALITADLLLSHRVQHAKKEHSDWSEIKTLATPMFISMLGVAVFQSADVLAVKRWFTAIDAANYAAASSLARAISVFFVPVYTLAGPRLTGLYERGESLIPTALRLCAYFLGLAAIPVVVLALASDTVVTLLYGKAFREAGAILWRLSALPLLTYLGLLIGQALITTRDRRFTPVYMGFAIAQVIALMLARTSIDAIIVSQYVVQGIMLVVMLIVMMTPPERGSC